MCSSKACSSVAWRVGEAKIGRMSSKRMPGFGKSGRWRREARRWDLRLGRSVWSSIWGSFFFFFFLFFPNSVWISGLEILGWFAVAVVVAVVAVVAVREGRREEEEVGREEEEVGREKVCRRIQDLNTQ